MTDSYAFPPRPPQALEISGTAAKFPVRRIFCVGRNYTAHAAEMGDSDPAPPFFFTKPADAATNAETVPFPPRTADLHFEGELVIAIGHGGADIAPANASGHIFGCAAGLDLTRRDLQTQARAKGQPWDTAKAFDNAAPIGPITPLATTDMLNRGTLRTRVNGNLRQDGDIADMIWPVPALIAELSTFFMLEAGDLIFTGTPAGVGAVERGDQITVEIDGLAPLRMVLS
jgi:fumarylpyruvate hydrolase